MKRIQCDHISEVPNIAEKIIALCKDKKVWVFQGDMGAGKTTLIKAICEKLKIADAVSSPTFSIVNEYTGETGDAIYHFDFYRIEDPMEAFDMGIEEYFASGSYCFVEWAEKIPMFLPDEFALISIESESDEKRIIAIKTINQ
ncbi:tRNA (adenosine(37)-N6)-threonylcarbamoyltransferase complex ATPase subunit type 1 TsaE [Cyclobacterium sp. 1_MG-2023]|uniref:tRNA (adenosine(37)-N6)-threonylcarbamoyltransferase complex ATPase subunit type 1 TsaE n=1 Tax=Cyclobacterium sp. 1_MG-2023 TaxID=3062681 RepID=UPI0026E236E0|nr:tRNA (adenosine(37)-N6)-threonylcarbamoyltransferase complex ATPase subunit type 1 TsaE [Cyclobacterium sp. 1_MG-2023]MDO6437525.1 tRNA (adenosine(37)-N6)-threonylcarbamoyltransferase complex ATPase subunit type 1 TsaE [Cyclobacterium sp. 1_MG-2023]